MVKIGGINGMVTTLYTLNERDSHNGKIRVLNHDLSVYVDPKTGKSVQFMSVKKAIKFVNRLNRRRVESPFRRIAL